MFASRVDGLDVSGIRKLFEAASKDSIHLGIGEPHLQPADHVLAAYHDALDAGENKYSPTAGLSELRMALTDHYEGRWPGIEEENIAVTSGSTAGLYAAMQVLVEEGDEVLIPDPGFVLYSPHTRLAGGTAVPYRLPSEDGFQVDEDALVESITENTRAIVVNSPANPTGMCLDEQSVNVLADVAEDHDVWLLTDEAYEAFTYEGDHVSFLDRGLEKLGYFNTFSKRYAMTGWRLGYALAPPALAEKIRIVGYHMYAAPSTPAQHAALAALTGPEDHTDRMRRELNERRQVTIDAIDRVDGLNLVNPTGAIYAFPSYDASISSMELSMQLLEAGVVVVPGSAFGDEGEGHLRLTFAADPSAIEEGVGVIQKALEGT